MTKARTRGPGLRRGGSVLECVLLLLECVRLLLVGLRLGAGLRLVGLGLALGLLGVALGLELVVVRDVPGLLFCRSLELFPDAHQCTASFVFCALFWARSAPAAFASCDWASTSARIAFRRSVPLSC